VTSKSRDTPIQQVLMTIPSRFNPRPSRFNPRGFTLPPVLRATPKRRRSWA
jgi:hypothetical protein